MLRTDYVFRKLPIPENGLCELDGYNCIVFAIVSIPDAGTPLRLPSVHCTISSVLPYNLTHSSLSMPISIVS